MGTPGGLIVPNASGRRGQRLVSVIYSGSRTCIGHHSFTTAVFGQLLQCLMSAASIRSRTSALAGRSHPRRMATSMSVAACVMSPCSQNRSTVHPRERRYASVSRSRSMFRASLAVHHAPFVFGAVLCSEQPCQKHPSTNTATLARVNRMSARRRGRPGSGASTQYRRPRRWSSRRRSISGAVSRVRCRDMRREVVMSVGVEEIAEISMACPPSAG